MKALVQTLITLTAFYTNAQYWQQLEDFPGNPRDDGIAFVIGDSAYCGTGLTPWWSAERDFYGLNLSNETWFSIDPLPIDEERQYASGFASNSNGFVFGGINSTGYLNDLWMYEPINDNWIEKSPLPSFGRSGAACFVINDTAYFVGGRSSSSIAINEIWAYSIINDNWIQKVDFPYGNIWRASATQVNNLGYLIFGIDEADMYQNKLYQFDPLTDSWTQTSIFPSNGRAYSALNPV